MVRLNQKSDYFNQELLENIVKIKIELALNWHLISLSQRVGDNAYFWSNICRHNTGLEISITRSGLRFIKFL